MPARRRFTGSSSARPTAARTSKSVFLRSANRDRSARGLSRRVLPTLSATRPTKLRSTTARVFKSETMKAHEPSLEVCVDSAAGLDVATRAGVDRIELCSALKLAGLTPSAGLMAIAATKAIPCFVLIRPRGGDFCYDVRDVDLMRREIDIVRSMRLAGIVIGASRVDGSLDEELLRALLEHAAGLPAVLHRAFDLAA